MTNKTKTTILMTVSLVFLIAGFYFWINRPAARESTIRLTLKKSGCDKARAAGMLPPFPLNELPVEPREI